MPVTTKKAIDKVKLEQLIDTYIRQDIPLSLLTEEYNIPYPQLLLILNRTRGHNHKTNFLESHNPHFSYEEVSPDLIEIPHEIEEEYPMTYEEVIAVFTRLEELKNNITKITSLIKDYQIKIEKQKKSISSFNLDLITRIESFIVAYDSLPINDDLTIRNLLTEYHLDIKELSNYNNIYEDYLNTTKKLEELKKQLYNYQKESKLSIYQKEYDSIRNDIAKKNIKLVNWCIRRFFNSIPLPQEETQAFGFEALAVAINEFDYHKGYHFSSFAVPIIVNHIKRHFKELYGMAFRDFVAKEAIKYNRKIMKEADSKRYKNPTPVEISSLGLIGMSPQKISNYDEMIDDIIPFTDAYPSLELDERLSSSSDMPTTFDEYDIINEYEDQINLTDDLDTFEEVVKKITSEELAKILSRLNDQEKQIFNLRFGFSGQEPMTYNQIGKIMNLSRERIRQIEAKALRKIRHPRNIRNLRNYYQGRPLYINYRDLPYKTRSGDQIYLKLIDLLKHDFTYNGVLTFMNMEELNWQSPDLNNSLYLILKLCETVQEMISKGKDKDMYFKRHIADVFSTYKIRISEDFVSYIIENSDNVMSLIELFAINHNLYLKNPKIDENIEYNRRFL